MNQNELIERLDNAKKRCKDWINNVNEYENIYSCGASEEKKAQKNKRYNILFANTQILFAALFTSLPRLIIRPRTSKETLTNSKMKLFYSTVIDIIKKAVEICINTDNIKKVVESFKLDILLSGQGVLWCVFNAQYQQLGNDTKVTNERVKIEHVYYKDFLISSGRTWNQVWWIARRHKMTEEDIYKQFPNAELIKPQFKASESQKELIDVWEMWDKSNKKVYFVSDKCRNILKEETDPYGIEGFFPTPEPFRFILNNSNLKATPEYEVYKEEAHDLSICSQRIANLIKSIKSRALYSASNRQIADKLNNAGDNEYIAVEVSSQINELGIDKLFTYDPIEMKQKVAEGLYNQQQNLINNIYEITGISDIMRSISAVNETAEAISKKSKFGNLRLHSRQEKINNYIKEIYKIVCSLICELFSIETLQNITGVNLPSDEEKIQFEELMKVRQQTIKQGIQKGIPVNLPPLNPKTIKFYSLPSWLEIKAYIEDNKLRDYLFSVESDNDIFEDENRRFKIRSTMIEFIFRIIQTMLPFISQNPDFSDSIIRLIIFALSGTGLPLELQGEIESGLEALIEKIKSPKQPPPPPPEQVLAQAEMLKAQAEMLKAQIKTKELELETIKDGKELELEKQKIINDAKFKTQDNIIKAYKDNKV
ncbi:MAG: hypothetical protein LBD46_07835 [Endomicrobium sp.]|jgi:hypothetical protein|nr:hypothetical protein [Endomicrobium sp.]